MQKRNKVDKELLAHALEMTSEITVAFESWRSPQGICNLILAHLKKEREKSFSDGYTKGREEVREEVIEFVKSEAGKSGRREILDFLKKKEK
jgi:hypothetical protein